MSLDPLAVLCNLTRPTELIIKTPGCPILYSKYGNFVAEEKNNIVNFECLRNFHYVNGSKTRYCMEDGNWSGEDFYCEVDYYMERYKLSSCIVVTALSLSMIFFGTDLFLYRSKRHGRRMESRRRMSLYLKYNSSFDSTINMDEGKQFHRLVSGNPQFFSMCSWQPSNFSQEKSKETKVKSVREYRHQSVPSFSVSPQSSTYYESTPNDVWYMRSLLKLCANTDVTNNQPAVKGLNVQQQSQSKELNKGRMERPVSSERIHVPIAPDLGYQGIRLLKPTIKYNQFYREEEVLGFGREELKRKKLEKPEPEKPQKRKILMAMNTRKRSDFHDLTPIWTQREGRKRKHLGTL